MTKSQLLACNHDYEDEAELQSRYRIQLWFLNFYKYIYCLIYTSKILFELEGRDDDDDVEIDHAQIAKDKEKLSNIKSSIMGLTSIHNKKLLARGK